MDFLELLQQPALILPIATILGGFGGFPSPPNIFKQLSQNQWFQYLMLFVLAWQGGAGQDAQVALLVTFLAFVAKYVLDMVFPAPAAEAYGMY